MEKSKKIYELIVAVFFAVLSLFFLFTAFNTKSVASEGMMSAMDFPKIVLFGMLGFSLYVTVKNLMTRRERTDDTASSKNRPDFRTLITSLLIIAYVIVWKYVSFSIATWLYISIQAKVIDHGLKWTNCALIGLGISCVVVLVFKILFKVSLSEPLLISLGIIH